MYCNQCGKQLPENAKFCTSCGHKVVKESINNSCTPKMSQIKNADIINISKSSHKKKTSNKTKNKNGIKKAILIGFSIVILISMSIIAITYFVRSKETNDDTNIVNKAQESPFVIIYDIFDGGTTDYVLEHYPSSYSTKYEVVLEKPFFDIDGHYEINHSDGNIFSIIYRWDDDVEFNVKNVVNGICDELGKYSEYDLQFKCYSWKANGLEIDFYTEKGIWIDPIVSKDLSSEDNVEGCTSGKHVTGAWGEWNVDYDDAKKTRELVCSDCGEIVNSETLNITTFVQGGHFSIYASAFSDRFDEKSRELNNTNYESQSEYNEYMSYYDEDNTVYYRIKDKNNNSADVGIYSFKHTNGKDVAIRENHYENIICGINILIEDSYDVPAVVYAAILAIDPGIGYSEAADFGQMIVDGIVFESSATEASKLKGIDKNGINYILYNDYQYHYLVISIAGK